MSSEVQKLRSFLIEARDAANELLATLEEEGIILLHAKALANVVERVDEVLKESEHKWVDFHGTVACSVCSIVKRADGNNKPCVGAVPKIELREDNTCTSCKRVFKSHQALGLHFSHAKRNPNICDGKTCESCPHRPHLGVCRCRNYKSMESCGCTVESGRSK